MGLCGSTSGEKTAKVSKSGGGGTPEQAEGKASSARKAQGSAGKKAKAGGDKRKFKAKFKRRVDAQERDSASAGPLTRRCSKEELAGARKALGGQLMQSDASTRRRRSSRPSLGTIGESDETE